MKKSEFMSFYYENFEYTKTLIKHPYDMVALIIKEPINIVLSSVIESEYNSGYCNFGQSLSTYKGTYTLYDYLKEIHHESLDLLININDNE